MRPPCSPFCFFLLLLLLGVPAAAHANLSSGVLISAVYYDPFVAGEASEAIQLQNVGGSAISLANWTLSDGEGTVTFPPDAVIAPSYKVWVARSAAAFRGEFGSEADFEYGGDSDPAVPNLTGSAPALANAGDQVLLRDANGTLIDALVYGNATLSGSDWNGAAVKPYDFGASGVEGQILYRKRDEASGLPLPDTNSQSDWAQDAGDDELGKKVLYPGWDLDAYFYPIRTSEEAEYKFCVAPDHLYACLRDEILRATRTISIEIYALDHAAIVDALTQRQDAGVRLSVLLDGGALEPQGKWACQQIEAHGGQCWLMASKPQSNIHKRYASEHAKWLVVDGARALIGSENIGDDAMPSDDTRDGTRGTRGGFVVSDSPTLVAAAQSILDHDLAPAHHADIRRWGEFADDFPPLGFTPNYVNGGKGYAVKFPDPLVLRGAYPVELVQCPENCLRTRDALLGMIRRAGAGDTLLVEQLYEYPYWGVGTSNAVQDPNPRLEAYLAAARRGARVRILLDSFYDSFGEARSNYATCAYVNAFQARLDVECRLGNPAGRGIHLKLALVRDGNSGLVHLGSINGSETSNKLNRELALQIESADAYNYWAGVFQADWAAAKLAPHRQFLPLLFRRVIP